MKTAARQTQEFFQSEVRAALSARYLLFRPSETGLARDRLWPLILFLHGSGERGTNLAKVASHGPPRIVGSQPDFPFFVVSPQCPSGCLWLSAVLLALLDEVIAKYPVDRTRVYLTGLSMGGYATWNLAVTAPERFAAVVPICGGGDVLPILLGSPRQLRWLRTLGVWAFHGAEDPVVKLEESMRMIAACRQIGNDAKLTVYPHAGHDSWTETYSNAALYEWLLRHRRPSRAR